MSIHEVTNQPPALPEYNVILTDPVLREGITRWGRKQDHPELEALGALAGSVEARIWGDQADRNPPALQTHSPQGARIDEVDFHPAWHRLLDTAVSHGLTAEPWTKPVGTRAHLRRAAGFVAWSQVEAGHVCPVSMTYAAVPALASSPDLSAIWTPLLASRQYDFGLRPHAQKGGVLAGMGMTEKQGGSDLRTNTTTAVAVAAGPIAGGQTYRLTGHKWFCSAPMSDMFLILAQAPAGPSCFLVPRVLDDGERNTFALQRLKDKLGNRSNASAEIELDGTWGVRLGEEGRGIRTILDMVAATRLDCVLGSSATMRQALVRASSQLDAAISATVSAMKAAAGSSDPQSANLAAQPGARTLVEQLAITLQACLLTRFAPEYVSEAFVASRLDGAHGHTFGTLPSDLVHASAVALMERTFPR